MVDSIEDKIVKEDGAATETAAKEPVTVAEGVIVEGRVTRIKPFGALVSLPNGAQGLVHISHIAATYVQNIEDYLSIGDIVKVKVLSIDAALNKISLSIKETVDAPVRGNSGAMRPQTSFRRDDHRRADSSPLTFEDKLKEYTKSSSERLAGLNKRNKKR
ncbi:general stress protein 13 [Clostridia bacterium]|nr:general stress protein 13 [Clostridia bacterium]